MEVQHNATDPLCAGLPSTFKVVRYESATLPDPLPSTLDRVAWSNNGITLAVKSRTKPQWALFFQPGAYGGEQSKEVIRNFYTFTLGLRTGKPPQQLEWIFPPKPLTTQCVFRVAKKKKKISSLCFLLFDCNYSRPTLTSTYTLNWTKIPCNAQSAYRDFTTERFFRYVYHTSKRPDCEIFWFDSPPVPKGGSRFSFIGDTTGPNAFSVCVVCRLSLTSLLLFV